jgi:hypothetical protein
MNRMTFASQIAAFNALVGEWEQLNELYSRERRRAPVIDKWIRAHEMVEWARFLLLEDMAYGHGPLARRSVSLALLQRCLASLRRALVNVPPAKDRRPRQRCTGDARIRLAGDEADLAKQAHEALRVRHPFYSESYDEDSDSWQLTAGSRFRMDRERWLASMDLKT